MFMKGETLSIMIVRKAIVCAFFSVVFLCAFFNVPWGEVDRTEATSSEITRVSMAIARMQKLAYAEIEVILTENEKNAIKTALLSDKILPEDPNAMGSHLYSIVKLSDNNNTDLIIGTTGTGENVVLMKSAETNFCFVITTKNLGKADEVAQNIANQAFKNKTSNLNTVISSFSSLLNKNATGKKTMAFTEQERNNLPKLLLTDAWRFTNNFNHEKVKTFDTMLKGKSENGEELEMSFQISNGLYFANLSFYDGFENVIFEVPKQTFINLGL